MATNSFLVNSNPIFKNTAAVNLFIEPHIFMNNLIRHRKDLLVGASVIEIDGRYDFRPDRLAYQFYEQDFWFPALLVANNIGSMLQFKAEFLNFRCTIPDKEAVRKILNEPVKESYSTEDMIHEIFKI